MSIKIIQGHALDKLKELPDESVHCCVTSPPYFGLRSYGTEPQVWGGNPECDHQWESAAVKRKGSTNGRGDLGSTLVSVNATKTLAPGLTNDEDGTRQYRTDNASFCAPCNAWRGELGLEPTPDLYIEHMVAVFREMRRVLREDGTFWLNIGDSYASGGRATYRSGVSDNKGHLAQNDLSRPIDAPGIKAKDLLGIPWMLAFALRADGWYLRSEIIWSKQCPMPESVTDRPTCSHEKIFLFAKSARYFFDHEAVKENAESEHPSGNGYARDERLSYRDDKGARGDKAGWSGIGGKRNLRNVWHLGPEPYRDAHFATFPTEIPSRAIRAGTSEHGVCPACAAPYKRLTEPMFPVGHTGATETLYPKGSSGGRISMIRQAAREAGEEYRSDRKTIGWKPTCSCGAGQPVSATVLDPFSGAGTTALVADRLGRDAIGIELNPEYAKMGKDRVTDDAPLFANVS